MVERENKKKNKVLYLTKDGLLDRTSWENVQIALPQYDMSTVKRQTDEFPQWVHFGAGNIFRAYPAWLQQQLLNKKIERTGIIAVNAAGSTTFDSCYAPYDNLSLIVNMGADGIFKKEVIGSIVTTLEANVHKSDWQTLSMIFQKPSLQMVSFTITEKAYKTTDSQGIFLKHVEEDIKKGPLCPVHTLSAATALLYTRFCAGAYPLSFVSMDNCAKNGDCLKESILVRAKGWQKLGYVPDAFLSYLEDKNRVSFPLSMIDKIVPAPSEKVSEHLLALGVQGMEIRKTDREALKAPFVNSESTGYLVIEDHFPNRRPLLEKAGVYFTDRETVNKVEKMKVGSCLNPLHTALALFGCLFGYPSISEEMKDKDVLCFIKRMALEESMPAIDYPDIINPEHFLKEVLEERFTNPYIPDTPQRIAADTSQKIPVRFGEILRRYSTKKDLCIADLKFIPFIFALWLRYLLEKDDRMQPMEISPDPMLPFLKTALQKVQLGAVNIAEDDILILLKNSDIFGVDLVELELSNRILKHFRNMISGKDAVRKELQNILKV